MAFDVAIYTDVLAAESIDTIGGFNFQAASPGISGTDRQRIRESLLHRVLPAWTLRHDDLGHPPSCAYAVTDGRAYLARGTSTGRTRSGRPGNQLTQVIVTSDLDDFVPYRPAQLYGALDWTLRKAQTSTLEPWVTPLEIRPEFEVGALQEFAQGDPWVTGILPQFLTMLDEALAQAPMRLVLLHPDLDVVMRWIALGTLFVDAETARKVHFRALVDDPRRVDAQIVGVSPEFDVTDFGAANVLDLTRRAVPATEASESARLRVSWFLEHGAAGLNAVAIARRWTPALGSELAAAAARLVGLPEPAASGPEAWMTSVQAVSRLAGAGLCEDVAYYAEELRDPAVGYRPASAEEFRVAGIALAWAHRCGAEELACGLALQALAGLAGTPGAAGVFCEELGQAGTPLVWEFIDEEEAAGRLLGELLAGAPSSWLHILFAAGYILGAPVPQEYRSPAVATLAGRWLHSPDLGRDRWERWLAGREVAVAVGGLLVNALLASDMAVASSVVQGRWDFLLPVAEEPQLAGWLKAGSIGRIPVARRAVDIARTPGLPPEAWRIGLADAPLPGCAALWAEWIHRIGLPRELEAAAHASVVEALRARPVWPDTTGIGDWQPLLLSLQAARNPSLQQTVASYRAAVHAFADARLAMSATSAPSLTRFLTLAQEATPLLLPEIGWLLTRPVRQADDKTLRAIARRWGPYAMRAFILRAFTDGKETAAVEAALQGRRNKDSAIASAASGALGEILARRSGKPDSVKVSKEFRDEYSAYLSQHRETGGVKRWLRLSSGRSGQDGD